MSYHGVEKISHRKAHCKHCDKLIDAVIWAGKEDDDKNDLDYRIGKHIGSIGHQENYFDYMAYNHAIVDYING